MARNCRKPVVIAAAMAMALFLAGCAEDALGPEYGEISEEESGLQFYAPGLERGYRNIIAGQDAQFIKRMVALYGPKQGEYPHGQLVLIEMPPRRHFTRIDPPRDMIEEWGPFENRVITHGPEGTAVNAIGRIDYAVFQADRLSCVIFRQVFGTVHETGRGTRLLDGYYCKGETPMMTKGDAVAIVKAVGHRKYGSITPPEGWPKPLALKIQAIWSNESSNADKFAGQITFPPSGKNGAIRIGPDTGRDCSGAVIYDGKEEDKVFMLWSLACTDGVTARGKLTINKVGGAAHLVGDGEDSEGRNIAIVY